MRATFRPSGSTAPIAVPFLIDTGAVSTIIMPGDAAKLNLDFAKLAPPIAIAGIGGAVMGHPVSGAMISLLESGNLWSFLSDVRIVDPAVHSQIRFPSILGHATWSLWGLSICNQMGHIEIDPRKTPDIP